MTLSDEKKRSSLEYGEHGYKHFHPWFLADLNPSLIDEYFRLIMEIFPHVDPILNREEYWFFRADINILMMWYRVSMPFSPLYYYFYFLDDMGIKQLPICSNYSWMSSDGILSPL